MPAIIQSNNPEYKSLYTGFDMQDVSLGLTQPGIYATDDYRKKKVRSLAMGMVSKVVYAGFDHDATPTVIPFLYEPGYNTVLALNIRYIPSSIRKAVLKYILESNRARIRSNQSIVIDYHSMKQAIPQIQGIVRRYKVIGIGVRETIPLNEWPSLINEQSQYQNHYKLGYK